MFMLTSCRETARDRFTLKRLGVTHILNAAEGTWNSVDTGPGYYKDMDIVYYGLVAEDIPTFDLSQYFFSAAKFIRDTLSNPDSKTFSPTSHQDRVKNRFQFKGTDPTFPSPDKLLVHCVMGRSRSATLFLAYLMINENMTVVDAIEHVKRRRRIIPNWGFLKQLRELDQRLLEDKKSSLEES